MKKYNVLIEETCGRNITVEARDEEHADEIVQALYDNDTIVLDHSDLSDVVIGGEYTEEAKEDDKLTVLV